MNNSILLLLACGAYPVVCGAAPAARETVHFKTAGGCSIEAAYHAPASGSPVFINIHGLGSNKGEWRTLESGAEKRGYGYLSIDLRGHGGSLECPGRRLDYKSFSPAQWGGLSEDIKAAADYLKDRKIARGRIVLCGASIGANLSLKAAAEGLKPAGIILLSPGLSYAGIESVIYLNQIEAKPLLLAASENDPYAWQSAGRMLIAAKTRGIPAVFRQGPGGHGANMLSDAEPALLNFIFEWVKGLGLK